jgi:hypothetical protein
MPNFHFTSAEWSVDKGSASTYKNMVYIEVTKSTTRLKSNFLIHGPNSFIRYLPVKPVAPNTVAVIPLLEDLPPGPKAPFLNGAI